MIAALVGQKGGTGKSTTTICLAAEAGERGKRVLIVDADPQGTARTWAELATETAGRSLWMPTTIALGEAMHRPDQLPRLSESFDHVFVDCPPRHGGIQRSALMVASVAVLPCGPSAADAWALASSIELVQEAMTMRPDLKACVVITRRKSRTALGKGAREMLEAGGLPVLTAELGDRVSYQEAIAAGLGVSRYAPKDAATTEIKALLDELLTFAGEAYGNQETTSAAKKTAKRASKR